MRPIARLFVDLLGDLADLVAPHRCVACHTVDPRPPPLCARCLDALEPADAPPPGVTAPYAWGGPLATAIARAKYSADPAPAASLGALLVPAATALGASFDRVVPVPLHPARLAQRGYNQSAELCRAVARAMDRRVDHAVLARVRDTPSQRTLGRAAREANVRGAFVVRASRGVAGARVLLVDDVVTTGATLAAARAALLEAGARSVHALTLARAPLDVTVPPTDSTAVSRAGA